MGFIQLFNINKSPTIPSHTIDISNQNVQIYTPFQIEQIQSFKLPISYLDKSTLHYLTDVVSTDLELVKSVNGIVTDKSMYNYISKQSHPFSKLLIPNWEKHYTTNIDFLENTKTIIKRFDKIREHCNNNLDCDRIFDIWDTVKQDNTFLERYGYINWDIIKELNHSSSFLQFMSFVNISSPLISLIIPFIFLLFPFVLLKIQRIPISFTSYIDILKNLAKHHFIGKTISTIQTFSWDKIVYVLITFGLYLLQIYQNINSCI